MTGHNVWHIKKKRGQSNFLDTNWHLLLWSHIFFSKDPDRSGHVLGGLRANQLTEMAPALSAHRVLVAVWQHSLILWESCFTGWVWAALQCQSEVLRFSLGNVKEKNALKHLLENVLFSTLWKCLWVNWELWTYWVLRMLGLVAGRDNKKLRGNNILCVLLSILFPGWPNNHMDGCLCVWTNVESLWTVKLYLDWFFNANYCSIKL